MRELPGALVVVSSGETDLSLSVIEDGVILSDEDVTEDETRER